MRYGRGEQRAILVLRHFAGFETNEIAEILGIPPGTARSRLHYALAKLRTALTAAAESLAQEGRLA